MAQYMAQDTQRKGKSNGKLSKEKLKKGDTHMTQPKPSDMI